MTLTVDPKAVEDEARTLAPSDIAQYLGTVFGWQLLGFILGMARPKDQPLRQEFVERPEVSHRLRSAYQAARLLDSAYGYEMTQTWFFGENSRLGGTAPAIILRETNDPQKLVDVINAAYTFVGPAF